MSAFITNPDTFKDSEKSSKSRMVEDEGVGAATKRLVSYCVGFGRQDRRGSRTKISARGKRDFLRNNADLINLQDLQRIRRSISQHPCTHHFGIELV